jgi:DNA-binding LytR/AlgR family response regulator
MSPRPPSALVADDEPLLRERLVRHLQQLWPELQVVAQARNGREAVELFDEHEPDIVFLDVHMPGMNGIDAARAIARRAELVFVTAYEQYALQAFDEGALDYLVKPFDEERLADTVQRLRRRLATTAAGAGSAAGGAHDAAPGGEHVAARGGDQVAALGGALGQTPMPGPAPDNAALDDLLQRLAGELARRAPAQPWLQWIKASSGNTVRLIPVDEIVFLRSDEKYTLVVWAGGEAVIRKTLRELGDELEPGRFVQVHRSAIVNLHHVSHVVRGANETADVHLRGRPEVLPVSRSYLHVFRQM